jgi:hypothetical protein
MDRDVVQPLRALRDALTRDRLLSSKILFPYLSRCKEKGTIIPAPKPHTVEERRESGFKSPSVLFFFFFCTI